MFRHPNPKDLPFLAPTGIAAQPKRLKYSPYPTRVVKELEFDAAHHLYDYDGKCRSLHGHRYKLQIGVRAEQLDANGFVIDFGDIKKVWKEHIEPLLDHRYLNESLPPMNTTAENMVGWIYQMFCVHLEKEDDNRIVIDFVRLYETPTSYAEIVLDV